VSPLHLAWLAEVEIGKEVAVLCGFVNNGEDPINVTGITGTLNDPSDFRKVLMNVSWLGDVSSLCVLLIHPFALLCCPQFTGQGIDEEIDSNGEVTYAYRFKMPTTMPPQTLQVALSIFFWDGGEQTYNTFYNATVNFVEAEEEIDFVGLAKTFGFVLAAAAGAYAIYNAASDSSPSATASTVPPSSGKSGKKSGKRGRKNKR
jgi:hypothetical protein